MLLEFDWLNIKSVQNETWSMSSSESPSKANSIRFSVLSCQSRVLPQSVYKLTGTINLAQLFVLK